MDLKEGQGKIAHEKGMRIEIPIPGSMVDETWPEAESLAGGLEYIARYQRTLL